MRISGRCKLFGIYSLVYESCIWQELLKIKKKKEKCNTELLLPKWFQMCNYLQNVYNPDSAYTGTPLFPWNFFPVKTQNMFSLSFFVKHLHKLATHKLDFKVISI